MVKELGEHKRPSCRTKDQEIENWCDCNLENWLIGLDSSILRSLHKEQYSLFYSEDISRMKIAFRNYY